MAALFEVSFVLQQRSLLSSAQPINKKQITFASDENKTGLANERQTCFSYNTKLVSSIKST